MFITLTNTPFLSAYGYHSNCTIARATDKIPCDLKWSFWCYSAEVHKPVEWCLRVCSYLQRIYHIQSRADENGFLWWTFIWCIAMHLPLLFFHCSRPFVSALQFNKPFFLPYLLGEYLGDPMPAKSFAYLLAKSLPVATYTLAETSGWAILLSSVGKGATGSGWVLWGSKAAKRLFSFWFGCLLVGVFFGGWGGRGVVWGGEGHSHQKQLLNFPLRNGCWWYRMLWIVEHGSSLQSPIANWCGTV